MSSFIQKIEEYELVNYLIPGVMFVLFRNFIFDNYILKDEGIIFFLKCYIIGFILSRVGSVVIEPALRKIYNIKPKEYELYCKAERKDEKIKILLKNSNLCRNCVAMILAVVVETVLIIFPKPIINKMLFFAVLLWLFAEGYSKQTNMLIKRIGIFSNCD